LTSAVSAIQVSHGVEAQSPCIEVGVDPLLARPVGRGLNSRDRLSRHLAGLDELEDGTLELYNECRIVLASPSTDMTIARSSHATVTSAC
jgi:hypothetical protein